MTFGSHRSLRQNSYLSLLSLDFTGQIDMISILSTIGGTPSRARTVDTLIKSGTCPFRASYTISNSMKSTIFNLITLFFKSVAHLILHLHTILFYLKSQQLFAFRHLHKFIKTCSFGVGQFHCHLCGDFSVFPIRIHLFPIVGIGKCGTS